MPPKIIKILTNTEGEEIGRETLIAMEEEASGDYKTTDGRKIGVDLGELENGFVLLNVVKYPAFRDRRGGTMRRIQIGRHGRGRVKVDHFRHIEFDLDRGLRRGLY